MRMSLIKDLIFTHCVIMPRLSPKERVSRRYKEHIDSLTEGENSHEHPPSFFPVRQERVAAGGVLCYILRCVCGHSLKKARALSLERNHQASAADGLRVYGNRYSLCLPNAGKIRHRRSCHEPYPDGALSAAFHPVGLFTRSAHYPAADAALPAADGGADAAVAHTADAEIQRCHRFDGGAVHMVSLLSADAVPPAAVGVYRPVHGKVRGLPPEPWNRYAVDHPCGTVSTGDHQ